MSCSFYTWRGDYYCLKKRDRVSEDIYYKYCRNYDYDYCPIYKDQGESGGCYLTSACVEAMGLPDDCEELTILRDFRDNWLAKQPGGQEEIQEYYRVAPGIVAAIKAGSGAKEAFAAIYRDLVLPCVETIRAGKREETWRLYRDKTNSLKENYSIAE